MLHKLADLINMFNLVTLDRLMIGGSALFVLIVLIFWITRRKGRSSDAAWLPPELQGARLIGVESDLSLRGEFNINGRLDRLYQLEDGRYVPVERKNHRQARVFSTDKLQLSIYRYILECNGHPVAPYGFVVLPHFNHAMKTKLYDRDYVRNRLKRYALLRAGQIDPKRESNGKCTKCSHANRCAA